MRCGASVRRLEVTRGGSTKTIEAGEVTKEVDLTAKHGFSPKLSELDLLHPNEAPADSTLYSPDELIQEMIQNGELEVDDDKKNRN